MKRPFSLCQAFSRCAPILGLALGLWAVLPASALAQPPSAPTGFTARLERTLLQRDGFDVVLEWAPPLTGLPLTAWRVTIFKESILFAPPATTEDTRTMRYRTFVPPGSYLAQIVAINRSGESPPASVGFQVPAPGCAPSQVTGVLATVLNMGVTVSWIGPSDRGCQGLDFYELLVTLPDGSATEIALTSQGPQTFVVRNNLALGVYTVRVRAYSRSDSPTLPGPNVPGLYSTPETVFTIVPPGGSLPNTPIFLPVVVSGSTVTMSWTPATTGGRATGFEIQAVMTSGEVVSVPVAGTQTSLTVTSVPAGSYRLRIRAVNEAGASAFSPEQQIVVGAPIVGVPGMPTLRAPVVTGSTVTLSWTPSSSGGTPAAYDIEGFVEATGQIVPLSVANQTSLAIPNVPRGNFRVRMRARNAAGASAYTTQQLVVVGTALQTGDLQVTLTWNTGVDLDLHVIEPNGRHVYYGASAGTTARLDVDDRDGYGPENIFVASGAAAAGAYQVFISNYNGTVPTTATISVVLFRGTANERSVIFSRLTSTANARLGLNIANVDVRNRTITETSGTRSFDERDGGIRAEPVEERSGAAPQ